MNLSYVDVDREFDSPFKATLDGKIVVSDLDLLNDLFPEGYEAMIQLESEMGVLS